MKQQHSINPLDDDNHVDSGDVIPEKQKKTTTLKSDSDPEATRLVNQSSNKLRKTKTDYLGKKEETVHRFSLSEVIGEGAMGEIVNAKDQDLLRKVAFKKILPDIAKNPKILRSFLTEAQITAQLEHPSIIPIYGLEINNDGEIAYSMKMIKGRTLANLIDEAKEQYEKYGRVDEDHSLTSLLEHFLKVCDAVHYAHMKGIIHRDLKPDNLMIGSYNEVYVMDWGVSRLAGGATESNTSEELIELLVTKEEISLAEKGRIIGTPRYMSPQQAAGKNDTLDGQSDQFSLGLILFELVTLKKAFNSTKAMELLKKVLKAELEAMVHYHPKGRVPKELKAIINKATARKTDGRYESVEAFSDDIRRFLRGEAVIAQPDTLVQSIFRWMIGHKELTAISVLSLLLISAGISVYNIYQHEQALIRAQIHENKLNQLLHDVTIQSQKINTHFLQIETLLEGLGSVTNALLMQPETQTNEPIYITRKLLPTSLQFSNVYKGERSTEHWVSNIAHGANYEDVKPDLAKLIDLNPFFQSIFLKSAQKPLDKNYSKEEIWDLIGNKGTSIVYAYVGLESGAYIEYPGGLGYMSKYDHRKRPWYIEAKKARQRSWITPYVDGTGLGLLISCEMPLFDQLKKFQGVAGIDMTFNYVKDHLLSLKNHPKIQAEYLLDQDGKIILNSKEDQDYKIVNKIREHKPFHHSNVIKEIQQKKSGYLIDDEQLIAYYLIDALDWYYVIEGVESKLLENL